MTKGLKEHHKYGSRDGRKCLFENYDVLNISMLHKDLYYSSKVGKYLKWNDFPFPGHKGQWFRYRVDDGTDW